MMRGAPSAFAVDAVGAARRNGCSPAAHFLLRCLSKDAPEARAAALGQCAPDVWPLVVDEAQRLAVAPLVYYQLRPVADAAGVPPRSLESLRVAHASNAWRNLRLYTALYPVLDALHDAGVRVIILKGACLAHTAYRDVSLRVIGDVDLLVDPTALARAEEVLRGIGLVGDERNPEMAEDSHHFVFSGGAMQLDLHWAVSDPDSPYRINLAGIWDRARSLGLMGGSALCLSPEDEVVYCCYHVACHHVFEYGAMRSLCDLVEVISRHAGEMDWTRVWQIADEAGLGRATHLTLQLASDMLGLAPAPGIPEAIARDGLDPEYAALARARVLANRAQAGDTTVSAEDTSGHFGRIRVAKGPVAKGRAFFTALFPSREFIAREYNVPPEAAVVYFCYLARIARLLRTRAKTVISLATGDEETVRWTERQAWLVQSDALARWLSTDATN